MFEEQFQAITDFVARPYFRRIDVPTVHHGVMRLIKAFGPWEILGRDGTEQGTRYMDRLWRNVCRRAAHMGLRPKRALVLGVALGGTFNVLRTQWPDIRVVGVDWEPELLELGKKYGIWRDDERVTFYAGDAEAVVPALDDAFDLIIVDLFGALKIADAARGDRLPEACTRLLAPEGLLFLNFFTEPDATRTWDSHLRRVADLRYKSNGIAAYRKPPST